MEKQHLHFHENIYAQIRQHIREGSYAAGSKLSENKLAREFSCSRIPVREAFLRLQQEGLVSILPHSGTYVRTYSIEDYLNAIEIRSYLEALAVDLILEHKTSIERLYEYYNQMQEIIDKEEFNLSEFGEYHYKFHRMMVQLSENGLLLDTYDRLHFQAIQQIFFTPMTRAQILTTHQEHRQILLYLEERSRMCIEFVIQHLWSRRQQILEQQKIKNTAVSDPCLPEPS